MALYYSVNREIYGHVIGAHGGEGVLSIFLSFM
jgi:hypothetical protein